MSAFQGVMVTPMPYVKVGRVDRNFQLQLSELGENGPYEWSLYSGNLPDGLTLDPGTGLVSGRPTTAGDYFVRYKVVGSRIASHRGDAQQHVSREQKITIRP